MARVEAARALVETIDRHVIARGYGRTPVVGKEDRLWPLARRGGVGAPADDGGRGDRRRERAAARRRLPVTPAVRLVDVTKVFETDAGPFTAVTGVDLAVAPGEFVAVVGPSGCGKSTLLGIVSGLSPATSGTVEVGGRPLEGIPRGLGYLFQRDALLPWKTVLDNVALPLIFARRPRAEARDRARDWLARVGLSAFEGYHPHRLSGGMRKRTSLAATMVAEPEIVLMDEPFSALDVQTRNLMENELLAIWQGSRKTVLFITHDLEEAIALSDRVVVMTASPGRVKAEYPIPLPRPRAVTEVRFDPAFVHLYETIWNDLRDEVLACHAQAQRG